MRAANKGHHTDGILEGTISPQGERYGAEASVLALLDDLVRRSLSAQPPWNT